tara:strand:- start:737 stop:1015 length:279 start_codon:yes stop_codon:yes gene_type:complete
MTSGITRNFNRTQDVNVTSEQKDAIVNIGIAHLAVGNSTDFMLAMNSVSKLDVSQDLSAKLDQVTKVLSTVTKTIGVDNELVSNGVHNGTSV